MASDLSKLMQSLLRSSSNTSLSPWQPAADVYRCESGWLVKVDLAGIKETDLQLSTHGRFLSLQGVRRDLLIQHSHQSYSMEIAYNRFERVIELPFDIEQADISTEYLDGMLLVHIQTAH